MSDAEVKQVNKSHNRKKEKYKKKNNSNNSKFSESKNEIESEENLRAKSDKQDDFEKAKARNPRAFAINSTVSAERAFRRLV
jgi:hypothetical protein